MEILRLGEKSGFGLGGSTYVGMGGFKFYDFSMFHRQLNIRNMISIEGDPTLLNRCDFNKPFDFVEIFPGLTGEFIEKFSSSDPHVFWLDYDQGIQKNLASDMIDLGAKLPPTSFLFVSIKADPGGPYSNPNPKRRLKQLSEDLPRFSRGVVEDDLSRDNFKYTSVSILNKIASNALSGRSGEYRRLGTMLYKDGAHMATSCFVVGEKKYCDEVSSRVSESLPFLAGDDGSGIYTIPNLNLSDTERRLLDLASTSDNPAKDVGQTLKRIGFDDQDVNDYRVLLRYLPRYYEAYF